MHRISVFIQSQWGEKLISWDLAYLCKRNCGRAIFGFYLILSKALQRFDPIFYYEDGNIEAGTIWSRYRRSSEVIQLLPEVYYYPVLCHLLTKNIITKCFDRRNPWGNVRTNFYSRFREAGILRFYILFYWFRMAVLSAKPEFQKSIETKIFYVWLQ